ncbi:tetratricopeptide repeat protein [Streptomyces sp. NPDC056464]|uniref:tetratricopeptide repeat protein n=1 Tax=Streptomyces sp. NPDC056464 TaxID=3345828 RepID=UPI00368CF976
MLQVGGDLHVHDGGGARRELPLRPVDMLPAAPECLVGREALVDDLLQLLESAQGSASGAGAAVAVGMAGVGKSALILHVAHEARQRAWFSVCLFVALHGYVPGEALTPGQALESLLRGLGVEGAEMPTGVDDRAALYQAVLGRFDDAGERVLVVVDDAADAGAIRRLLPTRPQHRLLATSRDRLASLPARLVKIQVLSASSSTSLVTRALAQADPADMRAVSEARALASTVERCGFLPLALHIVSALLVADPGLRMETMAADLRDMTRRLRALRHQDGEEILAVESALELSYRRLEAGPAQAFRRLALNPGPDVSTEAVAALTQVGEREARAHLAALAAGNLLAEEPVGSSRWRMHDLVRAYVMGLTCLDEVDERADAFGRLVRHYTDYAEDADSFLRTLGNADADTDADAPTRFSGRVAALAWLDAEHLNLVAILGVIHPDDRRLDAVWLAMALREYLLTQRHFGDAVRVLEPIVPLARAAGGVAQAIVLDSLGSALHGLGRSDEAVDLHGQAATLTSGRLERATILNNLGNALLGARRFAEAADAYRRAADLASTAGDLASEGRALTNLGRVLEMAGLHTEAADVLRRAVAVRSAAGDHYGEARAMDTLGSVLAQLGQLAEAAELYTRAGAFLADYGDHVSHVVSLQNFANSLCEAGQIQQAITLFTRAVEIITALDEPDLESTVLSNLSRALTAAGQHAEAIARASEAVEKSQGHNLPATEGRALLRLAIALDGAGQTDKAIETLAAAADRSTSCADRHGEGIALTLRGFLLAQVGRIPEAVEADERAVAAHAACSDHAEEARTLVNLSLALEALNRVDDTIDTYARAAHAFVRAGDPAGQQVSLHMLSTALQQQQRYDEAIEVRKQAVEVATSLGDQEDVHQQWMAIGCCLDQQQRFSAAVDAYRQAVSAADTAGPTMTTNKLEALNSLGVALLRTSQHAAAIKVLKQAVTVSDPKARANAQNNLGVAQQTAGHHREAIALHQRAHTAYRRLGDQSGQGSALNNLGLALTAQQHYAQAMDAFTEAARLHAICGDLTEATRALVNRTAAEAAFRGQLEK